MVQTTKSHIETRAWPRIDLLSAEHGAPPFLQSYHQTRCCALKCPHESVRVFTSEKTRQAHRARAHGHRAMARDFVSDERCPASSKVFGSRPMAVEHLQCRAQRCRRKMLDGLLPRLPAAVYNCG